MGGGGTGRDLLNHPPRQNSGCPESRGLVLSSCRHGPVTLPGSSDLQDVTTPERERDRGEDGSGDRRGGPDRPETFGSGAADGVLEEGGVRALELRCPLGAWPGE